MEMPKKGLYTFFFVLAFATGVIWGLLAIKPYKNMNIAIEQGNAYEAQDCAKKVRMFALIGVAVNILFLIFSFANR